MFCLVVFHGPVVPAQFACANDFRSQRTCGDEKPPHIRGSFTDVLGIGLSMLQIAGILMPTL